MLGLLMPELLRPGDTVAIIATSGPCDSNRLVKGVEAVKSMGLRPWVLESCRSRHGYFAGPDDLRLRDLHTAFASPDVRGIFVARGGYGAGRLLPYIDYDLLRNNPKVFVGYSDVTALHVAINQCCRFATFHGPMPAADFGKEYLPLTMDSLRNMIFSAPSAAGSAIHKCEDVPLQFHPHKTVDSEHEKQSVIPRVLPAPLRNIVFGHASPLTTIVPGQAGGLLTGGNLSLLAASLGTPYEVDTKGCILFIEETNEDPYSVDRMLLQLQQAGKLSQAAGIVLGDFGPQTPETLHICISEIIAKENKPTLAGLASGHCSPNITLPLGRYTMLDAD